MNPLTIFFIVLVIVLLAIGFYFIFKDDENPNPGPTPGPTPGSSEDDTYIDPGVTGRYVKLIHTVAYNANRPGGDESKHANINFAELEVFDIDGNNLSLAKTVTGSSFRGAAAGWKLVDGDFTSFAQTISRNESEKDYMMVDLGLSTIKKIKITNRSADDRKIQGVKLLIIDEDGDTIKKETPEITTVANTYTITFPENVWTTS
jgi:hypothetical protein